jgi:hypothetical protein
VAVAEMVMEPLPMELEPMAVEMPLIRLVAQEL